MKGIYYVLFVFLIIGCATEVHPISPCEISADTLQYYKHVYPIINRKCSLPTCHVNGFEKGDFKNAEDVKQVATNGKLESMIITRQMPPGISDGPLNLTDCEINTIILWINNGALIE